MHEHKTSTQKPVDASGIKYACPMHCEGDKTYDSPGKCPVCGMNLVPVQEVGSRK